MIPDDQRGWRGWWWRNGPGIALYCAISLLWLLVLAGMWAAVTHRDFYQLVEELWQNQ